MKFIKYRIVIERVDESSVRTRDWHEMNSQTGVHDYSDWYDRPSEIKTELLTQEIRDEQLDIKAVIKAINGI